MVWCLKYDAFYLRSFLAVMKIIQIIFLLIAYAIMQSFINLVLLSNFKFSKMQFFVLVTAIGWISYLVMFCLNLFMVTNNFLIPWYYVYLISDVVFALFLSIAVTVIAVQIDTINNTEQFYIPDIGTGGKFVQECELITLNSSASCSLLNAGVIFGALGICAILLDIVVCIHKIKKGQSSHYNSTFPNDNITVSTADTITNSSIPSRQSNHRLDFQEYRTEGMF
nr:uncharacterized protein LOC124814121 [Hydra vulgaris]